MVQVNRYIWPDNDVRLAARVGGRSMVHTWSVLCTAFDCRRFVPFHSRSLFCRQLRHCCPEINSKNVQGWFTKCPRPEAASAGRAHSSTRGGGVDHTTRQCWHCKPHTTQQPCSFSRVTPSEIEQRGCPAPAIRGGQVHSVTTVGERQNSAVHSPGSTHGHQTPS